ncbi:MAG: HAD family phosphatase [Eubacterium sp.]|nr:HAD family phosphatase [Eubacterium sp.]
MEKKKEISRKMLFLDLDGTLLNDQKEVTEGNFRAIERAVDAGHIVTITTGRPLASSIEIARNLGLVKAGCYLICFNGALIYDLEKRSILSEETLDVQLVEILFEEAQNAGIHIHTYSHEKILARGVTPELLHYQKLTGMEAEFDTEYPKGINPPNKVLLCELDSTQRLEKFQADHRYLEKGRCQSAFSCEEYLEYNPVSSSKGAAIRKMAKLAGIDRKDTIAVGDERNDLSMIQAAGIGVAMKNGQPQVKEAADYITEHDNNEDAIEEVIDKFCF